MVNGERTDGRVYLDHAATSPLRPEALAAFTAAASAPGNPSSLTAAGRARRALLEDARDQVAGLLGVTATEILFTSGGTEADNIGVRGIAEATREACGARDTILVSAIEHPAVLETARRSGFRVIELGVTTEGVIDMERAADVVAAEGPRIAVCSVQRVNNEIGTVQPVPELAELVRAEGAAMHTDAVQAAGHLSIDPRALGVNALSLSGHKLGGPIGCGVLVLDRATAARPIAYGGGQERDIRSGTLDAAGASAFAAALTAAEDARAHGESARLARLRDRLVHAVTEGLAGTSGVSVTGLGAERSSHIVHLLVPGARSETLLFLLDRAGIDCSTGSACRAGVVGPSHVVAALGLSPDGEGEPGQGEPGAGEAGAIRLSLGWSTRESDVDAALTALPGVIETARDVGV